MMDEDLKLIDDRVVKVTSLHLPCQSGGDCTNQLVSTGQIFVMIFGTFVKNLSRKFQCGLSRAKLRQFDTLPKN